MSAEIHLPWYRSLRLRLVLGALLVELVMLSLLVANSYRLISEALASQTRARIESLSPLFEAALAGRVFQRDRSELDAIISELVENTVTDIRYLVVLDDAGKVLAQAGGVPPQQLTRKGISDEDIASALADLIYDGDIPLRIGEQIVGHLRYGLSLTGLLALRDDVLNQSLLIAGIEILLSVLLLSLIGYFLTRHLKKLLIATRRLASADFSHAITIPSQDEIGILAQGFDRMRQEIQRRIEDLSASERRFRTVFDAAGEAIFIHRAQDGHLIDVNRRMCELYGCSREQALAAPFESFMANVAPFTLSEARQRIAETTRNGPQTFEWLARRYDSGETFWVEVTLSQARIGNEDCILAVVRDISERKRLEQTLAFQAFHDPLTHLPNRSLFADRLRQAIARSRRSEKLLAVIQLDLDGFKPVNDRYGHAAGDRLLIQVAQRLTTRLRDEDTVSRLGGDEFALLIGDLGSLKEAKAACQRLIELFASPFPLEEAQVSITASLGLTIYPFDEADPDTLLRHADQAMYIAKQAGRNRFHLFDAEHDRRLQERHTRLNRFAQALANGELRIHYQPQVDLASGALLGVEALVRWQHPEEGLLSPARFLPDVEDSELAAPLGEWVLDTVLDQIAQWRRHGLSCEVGVNIGARHLQLPDFIERLQTRLSRHPDLPPGCLVLEIVESVALADIDRVGRIIDACHRLGIGFALDDFGTGYSSLAYFKHLRIDTVKIDKSFVQDLLVDAEDRAIVAAVIALARSLERKVIAEGVESEEIARRLLDMGCQLGQGYGIARPMPADALMDWLARWQKESPTLGH